MQAGVLLLSDSEHDGNSPRPAMNESPESGVNNNKTHPHPAVSRTHAPCSVDPSPAWTQLDDPAAAVALSASNLSKQWQGSSVVEQLCREAAELDEYHRSATRPPGTVRASVILFSKVNLMFLGYLETKNFGCGLNR